MATSTTLPLPQGKINATVEEVPNRPRKSHHDGVIGLVNIGNSCYMNSSLQALSNCPPFRRYFIECLPAQSSSNLSAALSLLFRKMWTSERNPGHLTPRPISSSMKQRMFRGWQQQDSQEFLRCLFNQIHDELAVPLPSYYHQYCQGLCQSECQPDDEVHKDVTKSLEDQESSGGSSNGSLTQLITKTNPRSYSLSSYDQTQPLPSHSSSKSKRSLSLPNSPSVKPKLSTKFLYTQVTESLNKGKTTFNSSHILSNTSEMKKGVALEIERDEESDEDNDEHVNEVEQLTSEDSIIVDIVTGQATLCEATIPSSETSCRDVTDGTGLSPVESQNEDKSQLRTSKPESKKPTQLKRNREMISVVTEIFQGELESRVKCLQCSKVSVTREPFQDLSLPIPGRKELMKLRKRDVTDNELSPDPSSSTFGSRMCRVWNMVVGLTRDVVTGPATSLEDCLEAFFDSSDLLGENRYLCQHCKSYQNSQKEMKIVRLPEVLCIHLKRFRFDAFFTSKISRYIEFPLTGLDISPYMKSIDQDLSYQYELFSVVTHIGGAGGGHYVSYAKNSDSNKWYEFNDSRVSPISTNDIPDVEGYLLFYQRCPTKPVVPIKIADIIPYPETLIPSDDVCYISRRWLMLRNTCTNPGPLISYHFACEHGGVLPGCEEAAKTLAIPVRKEVWLELIERYGGGPLMSYLETCQQCQASLSELKQRRKQETNKVSQIQATNKGKPETVLLSRLWLKQWQDFIHCTSLEIQPPGPIDNFSLLTVLPDNTIKMNTKSQYRSIILPVWEYLHGIYGGGPFIATRSRE